MIHKRHKDKTILAMHPLPPSSKSTLPSVQEDDEATLNPEPLSSTSTKSKVIESLKLIASVSFLFSSIYTSYYSSNGNVNGNGNDNAGNNVLSSLSSHRRRLSSVHTTPAYMNDLMEELKARNKLFDDTPPEEVKYWFEYTGPLQKYFYRYSKSRGKADYFEGRDDSGVVSARFVSPGGGDEHSSFYNTPDHIIPPNEVPVHYRLLDNCFALGNTKRPNLQPDSEWFQWFGAAAAGSGTSTNTKEAMDRCRILITMNTVGAGKGATMLWETQPPLIHDASPKRWMSEQATAAMHLERNLREVDAMCKTGLMAVRLQVLVCEPIPGVWTDYMDSMLPNCGGQVAPLTKKKEGDGPYGDGIDVDERPSPVQVVVVASASTADTCHDLKSGFMEKRVQDLILAPPYLDKNQDTSKNNFDPNIKMTHPDLVSSDDYDLYIGLKWSSLVTIRSVSSFLQASADIAAAAASPRNQEPPKEDEDGVTVSLNNKPGSPFLIPSFVRVSYVSEENNKVAKWRMHGDFFHPAAWEVCKDSYDLTWINDSLSGNGGVSGICYDKSHPGFTAIQRRLSDDEDDECGQWWIYMAEEQMSLNPEVYANEVSAPLVQGGSNQFWMLTEKHRKEILTVKVCEHNAKDDNGLNKCQENPQAVIPLGDMESFLINFMPNTALGKKHTIGRRPGYSKEDEREQDRELVRERKQLKGQEDIEKALFDYTVYPAALFRKDATLKATRARDAILTKSVNDNEERMGPQTIKSTYYDVTIKKPRAPTLGWCQAIARKGLCTLYGQYFRESADKRCMEACGLKKNWTRISADTTN